jgi:hypothetical protein
VGAIVCILRARNDYKKYKSFSHNMGKIAMDILSLNKMSKMLDYYDIFSIVPIEVIQDKRLTPNQVKVLIALLSFRRKNTSTIWPSRDKLSQRCGLPINRISQITTQLVVLGWLEKQGKGGFSKTTRYQIIVPELETLTETVTVTETVRGGVTETVRGMPLSETVRGNKNRITTNNSVGKSANNKSLKQIRKTQSSPRYSGEQIIQMIVNGQIDVH